MSSVTIDICNSSKRLEGLKSMKVLFAVNNDDISNAIIKKYQKNYKEILSYKKITKG